MATEAGLPEARAPRKGLQGRGWQGGFCRRKATWSLAVPFHLLTPGSTAGQHTLPA